MSYSNTIAAYTIPCHLSAPVIKGKNQTKDEFIEERKNYFKNTIQRKRSTYNNKEIFLTKSDCLGDECFEKFAIGGEQYHKTHNFDLRRIERFDWIFEILEKIELCKKCGWIKIEKSTRFKNRTLIECQVNNFLVVIALAEHQNHYEVISAQYKRYITCTKRKNAR